VVLSNGLTLRGWACSVRPIYAGEAKEVAKQGVPDPNSSNAADLARNYTFRKKLMGKMKCMYLHGSILLAKEETKKRRAQ